MDRLRSCLERSSRSPYDRFTLYCLPESIAARTITLTCLHHQIPLTLIPISFTGGTVPTIEVKPSPLSCLPASFASSSPSSPSQSRVPITTLPTLELNTCPLQVCIAQRIYREIRPLIMAILQSNVSSQDAEALASGVEAILDKLNSYSNESISLLMPHLKPYSLIMGLESILRFLDCFSLQLVSATEGLLSDVKTLSNSFSTALIQHTNPARISLVSTLPAAVSSSTSSSSSSPLPTSLPLTHYHFLPSSPLFPMSLRLASLVRSLQRSHNDLITPSLTPSPALRRPASLNTTPLKPMSSPLSPTSSPHQANIDTIASTPTSSTFPSSYATTNAVLAHLVNAQMLGAAALNALLSQPNPHNTLPTPSTTSSVPGSLSPSTTSSPPYPTFEGLPPQVTAPQLYHTGIPLLSASLDHPSHPSSPPLSPISPAPPTKSTSSSSLLHPSPMTASTSSSPSSSSSVPPLSLFHGYINTPLIRMALRVALKHVLGPAPGAYMGTNEEETMGRGKGGGETAETINTLPLDKEGKVDTDMLRLVRLVKYQLRQIDITRDLELYKWEEEMEAQARKEDKGVRAMQGREPTQGKYGEDGEDDDGNSDEWSVQEEDSNDEDIEKPKFTGSNRHDINNSSDVNKPSTTTPLLRPHHSTPSSPSFTHHPPSPSTSPSKVSSTNTFSLDPTMPVSLTSISTSTTPSALPTSRRYLVSGAFDRQQGASPRLPPISPTTPTPSAFMMPSTDGHRDNSITRTTVVSTSAITAATTSASLHALPSLSSSSSSTTLLTPSSDMVGCSETSGTESDTPSSSNQTLNTKAVLTTSLSSSSSSSSSGRQPASGRVSRRDPSSTSSTSASSAGSNAVTQPPPTLSAQLCSNVGYRVLLLTQYIAQIVRKYQAELSHSPLTSSSNASASPSSPSSLSSSHASDRYAALLNDVDSLCRNELVKQGLLPLPSHASHTTSSSSPSSPSLPLSRALSLPFPFTNGGLLALSNLDSFTAHMLHDLILYRSYTTTSASTSSPVSSASTPTFSLPEVLYRRDPYTLATAFGLLPFTSPNSPRSPSSTSSSLSTTATTASTSQLTSSQSAVILGLLDRPHSLALDNIAPSGLPLLPPTSSSFPSNPSTPHQPQTASPHQSTSPYLSPRQQALHVLQSLEYQLDAYLSTSLLLTQRLVLQAYHSLVSTSSPPSQSRGGADDVGCLSTTLTVIHKLLCMYGIVSPSAHLLLCKLIPSPSVSTSLTTSTSTSSSPSLPPPPPFSSSLVSHHPSSFDWVTFTSINPREQISLLRLLFASHSVLSLIPSHFQPATPTSPSLPFSSSSPSLPTSLPAYCHHLLESSFPRSADLHLSIALMTLKPMLFLRNPNISTAFPHLSVYIDLVASSIGPCFLSFMHEQGNGYPHLVAPTPLYSHSPSLSSSLTLAHLPDPPLLCSTMTSDMPPTSKTTSSSGSFLRLPSPHVFLPPPYTRILDVPSARASPRSPYMLPLWQPSATSMASLLHLLPPPQTQLASSPSSSPSPSFPPSAPPLALTRAPALNSLSSSPPPPPSSTPSSSLPPDSSTHNITSGDQSTTPLPPPDHPSTSPELTLPNDPISSSTSSTAGPTLVAPRPSSPLTAIEQGLLPSVRRLRRGAVATREDEANAVTAASGIRYRADSNASALASLVGGRESLGDVEGGETEGEEEEGHPGIGGTGHEGYDTVIEESEGCIESDGSSNSSFHSKGSKIDCSGDNSGGHGIRHDANRYGKREQTRKQGVTMGRRDNRRVLKRGATSFAVLDLMADIGQCIFNFLYTRYQSYYASVYPSLISPDGLFSPSIQPCEPASHCLSPSSSLIHPPFSLTPSILLRMYNPTFPIHPSQLSPPYSPSPESDWFVIFIKTISMFPPLPEPIARRLRNLHLPPHILPFPLPIPIALLLPSDLEQFSVAFLKNSLSLSRPFLQWQPSTSLPTSFYSSPSSTSSLSLLSSSNTSPLSSLSPSSSPSLTTLSSSSANHWTMGPSLVNSLSTIIPPSFLLSSTPILLKALNITSPPNHSPLPLPLQDPYSFSHSTSPLDQCVCHATLLLQPLLPNLILPYICTLCGYIRNITGVTTSPSLDSPESQPAPPRNELISFVRSLGALLPAILSKPKRCAVESSGSESLKQNQSQSDVTTMDPSSSLPSSSSAALPSSTPSMSTPTLLPSTSPNGVTPTSSTDKHKSVQTKKAAPASAKSHPAMAVYTTTNPLLDFAAPTMLKGNSLTSPATSISRLSGGVSGDAMSATSSAENVGGNTYSHGSASGSEDDTDDGALVERLRQASRAMRVSTSVHVNKDVQTNIKEDSLTHPNPIAKEWPATPTDHGATGPLTPPPMVSSTTVMRRGTERSSFGSSSGSYAGDYPSGGLLRVRTSSSASSALLSTRATIGDGSAPLNDLDDPNVGSAVGEETITTHNPLHLIKPNDEIVDGTGRDQANEKEIKAKGKKSLSLNKGNTEEIQQQGNSCDSTSVQLPISQHLLTSPLPSNEAEPPEDDLLGPLASHSAFGSPELRREYRTSISVLAGPPIVIAEERREKSLSTVLSPVTARTSKPCVHAVTHTAFSDDGSVRPSPQHGCSEAPSKLVGVMKDDTMKTTNAECDMNVPPGNTTRLHPPISSASPSPLPYLPDGSVICLVAGDTNLDADGAVVADWLNCNATLSNLLQHYMLANFTSQETSHPLNHTTSRGDIPHPNTSSAFHITKAEDRSVSIVTHFTNKRASRHKHTAFDLLGSVATKSQEKKNTLSIDEGSDATSERKADDQERPIYQGLHTTESLHYAMHMKVKGIERQGKHILSLSTSDVIQPVNLSGFPTDWCRDDKEGLGSKNLYNDIDHHRNVGPRPHHRFSKQSAKWRRLLSFLQPPVTHTHPSHHRQIHTSHHPSSHSSSATRHLHSKHVSGVPPPRHLSSPSSSSSSSFPTFTPSVIAAHIGFVVSPTIQYPSSSLHTHPSPGTPTPPPVDFGVDHLLLTATKAFHGLAPSPEGQSSTLATPSVAPVRTPTAPPSLSPAPSSPSISMPPPPSSRRTKEEWITALLAGNPPRPSLSSSSPSCSLRFIQCYVFSPNDDPQPLMPSNKHHFTPCSSSSSSPSSSSSTSSTTASPSTPSPLLPSWFLSAMHCWHQGTLARIALCMRVASTLRSAIRVFLPPPDLVYVLCKAYPELVPSSSPRSHLSNEASTPTIPSPTTASPPHNVKGRHPIPLRQPFNRPVHVNACVSGMPCHVYLSSTHPTTHMSLRRNPYLPIRRSEYAVDTLILTDVNSLSTLLYVARLCGSSSSTTANNTTTSTTPTTSSTTTKPAQKPFISSSGKQAPPPPLPPRQPMEQYPSPNTFSLRLAELLRAIHNARRSLPKRPSVLPHPTSYLGPGINGTVSGRDTNAEISCLPGLSLPPLSPSSITITPPTTTPTPSVSLTSLSPDVKPVQPKTLSLAQFIKTSLNWRSTQTTSNPPSTGSPPSPSSPSVSPRPSPPIPSLYHVVMAATAKHNEQKSISAQEETLPPLPHPSFHPTSNPSTSSAHSLPDTTTAYANSPMFSPSSVSSISHSIPLIGGIGDNDDEVDVVLIRSQDYTI